MTTYEPNQKRYEGAKFRRCGKSGLVLPAISLGFWQNFGGVNVFETCRAVVRRAFDRGVTHFDLANMYGPSYGSAEENLGAILKKDFGGRLRDELLISTKAGYLNVAGTVPQRRLKEARRRVSGPELATVGCGLCGHFLRAPSLARGSNGGDNVGLGPNS